MRRPPHVLHLLLLFLGAALLAPAADAQTYPSKPIRWILGYPPGGGTDFIARTVAQALSANLGQPVVIENRPGAAAIVGAEAAAKSAPGLVGAAHPAARAQGRLSGTGGDMKSSCVEWRALALAAVAALAAHGTALAQGYPVKPVRIIVSLAPGGMADIFARTASPRLAEAGKQPFIVENRTGAGGNIGAELAAKSPPDGYTLYMGFHGTNAINPVLYGPRLPFDPFKDFTPVILVARVPNVLVVHPSVPVNSVQDLVALARAKPNALSYASQGTGSSGHMAGELFKITAGLDIVHIPYKGAAPAIQALLAGETQVMFDIVSLALPQIRSGKMKALAVVGPQRVAVLPELPTMAEAGLPQVEGGPWFGLFAPTGTPPAVIDWVNREVASTFKVPEVRERFTSQGVVFDLGPPESFAAHVAAERERWRNVIERAGIKLE